MASGNQTLGITGRVQQPHPTLWRSTNCGEAFSRRVQCLAPGTVARQSHACTSLDNICRRRETWLRRVSWMLEVSLAMFLAVSRLVWRITAEGQTERQRHTEIEKGRQKTQKRFKTHKYTRPRARTHAYTQKGGGKQKEGREVSPKADYIICTNKRDGDERPEPFDYTI